MVYAAIVNSKVIGGIVFDSYIQARESISSFALDHDLKILDIPTAIQIRKYSPKLSEIIQFRRLDTITSECKGLRSDGERYYEVWHSVGPLAKVPNFGFKEVSDIVWNDIENGTFDGYDVHRMHLSDLKKGDILPLGTPYSAFIRLERDNPIINTCNVSYDHFMIDDRILLLAGSLENREVLAEMHFGTFEDRLKKPGRKFGNTTRGIDDRFDTGSPMTRLMCFRKVYTESDEYYGIDYVDRTCSPLGRMAAVSLSFFDKPITEQISFSDFK